MRKPDTDRDPDIRVEYDFRRMRDGVRGKYAATGARFVMVRLDADVATAFPTSVAVNAALRRAMKTGAPEVSNQRRRSPAVGGAQRTTGRKPVRRAS